MSYYTDEAEDISDSTSFDGKEAGNEEQGPLLNSASSNPAKRKRRDCTVVLPKWLLATAGALLLITATSMATAVAVVSMQNGSSSSCNNDGAMTVDYTFTRNEEYHDFSHDQDHLWDELRPPNGGFNADGDGIAFFHQIHCMQMIREQMQALLLSSGDYVGSLEAVEGKIKRDPVFLPKRHVAHCFDYLRQTLECFADDTIEKTAFVYNGTRIINGYVQHKCRDKRPLWQMAEEATNIVESKIEHGHTVPA